MDYQLLSVLFITGFIATALRRVGQRWQQEILNEETFISSFVFKFFLLLFRHLRQWTAAKRNGDRERIYRRLYQQLSDRVKQVFKVQTAEFASVEHFIPHFPSSTFSHPSLTLLFLKLFLFSYVNSPVAQLTWIKDILGLLISLLLSLFSLPCRTTQPQSP